MNNEERDQLIAKLLGEGNSLSDVQKILQDEHGMQVTYMDLRLISSELEVNWEKFDTENAPKEKIIDPNAADSDSNLIADSDGEGKTVVNVSKVVRPGAVMSGDVKFKSGATAEWTLDPLGRLGLNPTGNSEKPQRRGHSRFSNGATTIITGENVDCKQSDFSPLVGLFFAHFEREVI